MTLRDLLRQLVIVAEQQPDCDIRINGEAISRWSLVLQRQIAVIGRDLAMVDHAHEADSRPVLNIYVNGGRVEALPASRQLGVRPDKTP
jgi:hypothetical protein